MGKREYFCRVSHSDGVNVLLAETPSEQSRDDTLHDIATAVASALDPDGNRIEICTKSGFGVLV